MSTDIERTIPVDGAVGPFLFHYDAIDEDDVHATIATYTHTCGYTRAWVDLIDPLRVWYLADCPADAFIASLQIAIDGFVATQITANEGIVDPYDQVQAIINLATDDAYTWIDANAYEHLATFLRQLSVTREQILLSLSSQGYTN